MVLSYVQLDHTYTYFYIYSVYQALILWLKDEAKKFIRRSVLLSEGRVLHIHCMLKVHTNKYGVESSKNYVYTLRPLQFPAMQLCGRRLMYITCCLLCACDTKERRNYQGMVTHQF